MKADRDEGVATVVAVMLVLSILVTCIAIYSSGYVPGLKQQSEIMHSEQVQFGFLRFSADVEQAYSLGKPVQFVEPITLGGGDILLSPVKSSGTINISGEQIGVLDVNGESVPINTTIVTYLPSYSSWESQGYQYEKGLVWVVKGSKRTPADLSLYTVQQGYDRENTSTEFQLNQMFQTLVEKGNQTTLMITTMSAGKPAFISGSGNVNLRLDATEIPEKSYSLPSGSSVTLRAYPSNVVVDVFTAATDTEFVLRTLDLEVSVV